MATIVDVFLFLKDISFVEDNDTTFLMIKVNLILSKVVQSMSKVILVYHSTCLSLLKFVFLLHILQLQLDRYCQISLCFHQPHMLFEEQVIGLPLSDIVSQKLHTKLFLQHIYS